MSKNPESTREFIDILQKENELLVIETQVDPYLELAEIQRRVVAKNGPALLFTNVKGSSFSVATNLYGSAKRIDLAFGKRPVDFIKTAADLLHGVPDFKKLWQARSLGFAALAVGLKKLKTGPAVEGSILPVDSQKLPALHCWPEDGGRFITLPLVYTESVKNAKPNLGMYRIQIHDKTTTGMHIQIHRGGGYHHHEAELAGLALPAHIYVGGPPALTLAAIAPLPEGISELLLASLLLGKKLPVIQNKKYSPLPIVAGADFTLAGEILPKVRKAEGPFGDHYGYYSLKHNYPVFQVKNIYHRKDAIWPATVVGRPPQEDHYIAEYLQELLSPLFPVVMPQVVNVWAYEESGVHSVAAAVVKERYHKESFTAAMRILGEGQLSLTKVLLVTDQLVELKNFRETFISVLQRFNPQTDLHILGNISLDTLDYTGPAINQGSKAVILGSGKKRNRLQTGLQGKFASRHFSAAKVFYPGVLLVSSSRYRKNDKLPEMIMREKSVSGFVFVFLVDDIDEIRTDHDFLWVVFTRFEPAGDIYGNKTVKRNHISFDGPVVIDCRKKPGYPGVLVAAAETVKLVDEKFGKFLDERGLGS